MHLKVLAGATSATNTAAPSGATAGVSLHLGETPGSPDYGFRGSEQNLAIAAHSTAGTGTLTLEARIWCYSDKTEQWYPLGTASTDTERGEINASTAVGEIATDKLQFTQVLGPAVLVFDRIYIQILAMGGSGTTCDFWLLSRG